MAVDPVVVLLVEVARMSAGPFKVNTLGKSTWMEFSVITAGMKRVRAGCPHPGRAAASREFPAGALVIRL
jgi:hypothetical protein